MQAMYVRCGGQRTEDFFVFRGGLTIDGGRSGKCSQSWPYI